MWKALILGGMAALLGSCASVQNITGGEQDTIAPKLVRALPPDRSTHFNARVIQLDLDERVQLERVRERLLISPPLQPAPDVRLAGPKTVEIKFNGPLEPNTTYTFNLGESVKDLTEGNIAAGLVYVVSTGDALDSAVVVGTIHNAFTGAVEKDMLVGLYAPEDTAAFRTGRPAYMTRSNATGEFTISNLPHGRYSAYALRDKNANMKYDLPNEEVAFLDSVITLDPTDTSGVAIALRSFLPASRKQQVRSYTVLADGALEVVFARPVEEVGVRDIAREGGVLRWQAEYGSMRDTVLFWPTDTTLITQGHYEISTDGMPLDTLRYKPTKRMPFNTGLSAKLVETAQDAFIRLRSSRPMTAFDTTRMTLTSDSTVVPYRTTQRDGRALDLSFTGRSGMVLKLLALPKTVRDNYGGYNDTLHASLGTAAERATGTLEVTVSGLAAERSYLLQVLDGQQRVQQMATISTAKPKAEWTVLPPGVRTLRLVHDRNGNGRWDTGEWSLLQQPETTWYHAETVNVRAAWDLKIEWKLSDP